MKEPRAKAALLASCLGGLASGSVILGIGGRVLMRLLAFATPEAPRFTWSGSLEIVGMAAAWGLVTGPLVLLSRLLTRRERLAGPLFGLLVFALAAVLFLLYSGFSGRIVAPTIFLWLSALSFPVLFILHGVVVDALRTAAFEWLRPKERSSAT